MGPSGDGRIWGRTMKHFKTEEWIDFVNRAASSRKQGEMRKHLESGCKRCAKTVALWQRVKESSSAEMHYQPPAETVRVVKAAYAASDLAGGRRKGLGVVELLFDTFLHPLAAGARTSGFGTRQMLYRSDPYQIDLQIEARADGRRLAVTGQLLDVSRLSHPGTLGRDVPVKVSNRRGHAVHLVTNEFGEFCGEIENTGDLELSISGRDGKPIVISLYDVLGQLSGGPE